jgi:hypothetical protein
MGEMEQVLEKLTVIAGNTSEVNSKVDKLLLWKASMEVTCKQHLKDTAKMGKTLYGNSGGGLVSDMRQLQSCKETVRQSASQWRGLLFSVVGTLVSVGIISFVVWLLFMYKSHGSD